MTDLIIYLALFVLYLFGHKDIIFELVLKIFYTFFEVLQSSASISIFASLLHSHQKYLKYIPPCETMVFKKIG